VGTQLFNQVMDHSFREQLELAKLADEADVADHPIPRPFHRLVGSRDAAELL
jgi:hypothetical protein